MNKSDRIRLLLTTETNVNVCIKLMIDLAWEYAASDYTLMTQVMGNANDLLNKAVAISNKECLQADLMTIHAFLLAKDDQFLEALKHAHSAVTYYSENNEVEGLVRAYRVIGLIYAYLGQLNDSLETNLKGLALMKKYVLDLTEENETPLTFLFLNNIATLYTFLNRYEEALHYYLEALPILKESSVASRVLILNNIGITYVDLNQTYLALNYLTEALNLAESESLGPVHLQLCHTGFALAYQNLKKADLAMHHFLCALEFAIQTGSKLEHLTVLIDICRYMISEGQYDNALEYLNQVLPIGLEIQANEILRTAYHLLAKCYEQLGQPQNALEYYKSYMEINQKVINSELLAKLDTFTATSQIEQAQKDAEIYKLKNVALKELNAAIEEKALQLEASHKNMSILSQIGHEITASLDIEQVLKTIYDRLNSLMSLNVFAIALFNSELNELEYKLFIEDSKRLPAFNIILNDYADSYAAVCIQNRDGILVNDLDPDAYPYYSFEENPKKRHYPRSLIYQPLTIGNEIIGVMTVQSYELGAYSSQNLEVVKILASYIAIALNNSKKSEALRIAIEELEVLSTTDPLTGLYNRRFMVQQLEREAVRYKRYLHPFTILIADIDHFKQINDTYGHDCGDFVLQQLAMDIKQQLRCQDFVARWGGEEFLILLTETDSEAAIILATRLLEMIAATNYIYQGITIHVTITLGLSNYNCNATIESIIKKADNALYIGKANGRNQCVIG